MEKTNQSFLNILENIRKLKDIDTIKILGRYEMKYIEDIEIICQQEIELNNNERESQKQTNENSNCNKPLVINSAKKCEFIKCTAENCPYVHEDDRQCIF
jgi:hypothetical protein